MLSGFIGPCLPSPAERPPSGSGWFHEIKLNGFRLMARRDAAGVRLLTRTGIDWSSRYPGIASAVNHLRCRSCLLDGEVVILPQVCSCRKHSGPARLPASA
jgi:bifunctional non-homologous end joining protein LigD